MVSIVQYIASQIVIRYNNNNPPARMLVMTFNKTIWSGLSTCV